MREQLGEVNAYTVDSIQGLKEIVAFTRGPWQLAALQAYGTQLNEVRRRFLNHLSFEHVLVEALMGAGGLVVTHLGLMHTPWIGAGVVLVALALTYWSGRLDLRDGMPARAATQGPVPAH